MLLPSETAEGLALLLNYNIPLIQHIQNVRVAHHFVATPLRKGKMG
jgi:hypothetical protein